MNMYSRFTNGKARWRRAGIALAFAASLLAGTPAGKSSTTGTSKPNDWITVKDKSGSCQMSVPGDWVTNAQMSGHVTTPEHTDSMVISSFKHLRKPMSDETQKAVGVDKIFENTPDRWFYAAKPIPGTGGKPTLVVYHIEVAREDGTCIAQILVNQNHPEEEVKKIAASVSAVKPQEKQNRRQP
jgi:hypothetical protein